MGVGRNRGNPLVPPDQCFDYFVTVDKVMPLRRAERKVRLRDLFCVKNVGIEQRRKCWKGKICYSLSQQADSSLKEGA